MAWTVALVRSARKALAKIPARDRRLIADAIDGMETDPFTGDLRRLRGEWDGYLRRRIGDWRIIFTVDVIERTVLIAYIERRGTTTYR